ncbi:MAG: bifunctional glycosyltransferase family 2/GtrA family protein [Pseudomonadota bacterium]|nr:bifunctional glycosyltransferase family 2/GtrA family protein [Gammaproteobacteria bacterium]MBU1926478.1 bifunctional glycosyltransferase family 2/GtrA family protein [Gammaproteobacteria bacterium]MBU2546419.1 bifunctional glycosyltransferase family 2/GtrA family protein [Gammaproteobacteria bacterium]
MIPINILIPAYNPDNRLITLVHELLKQPFLNITIVDDGSDAESQPIFQHLKTLKNVTLCEHVHNQGKGAALKTGFRYIQKNFPTSYGVITADADGQHLPKDIEKIAKTLLDTPNALILGARSFDRTVPFRSKCGNLLTRKLFRLMTGVKITDTQTGLRGIPINFIPTLLEIKAQRYEFELDMLLLCKKMGRAIQEVPISTVYFNNNRSSHFNPVIDSLKIYFELFRYILLSLATTCVDYATFFIAYGLGVDLLFSQVLARTASVLFNYPISKKMVFYSENHHRVAFPKYIALVIFGALVTYGIMKLLIMEFSFSLLPAKIVAELMLYISNYIIQRQFIFTHPKPDQTVTFNLERSPSCD